MAAIPCPGAVLDDDDDDDDDAGWYLAGGGGGICVGVSCSGVAKGVVGSVASLLLILLKKLTKDANLFLPGAGSRLCPGGRVWPPPLGDKVLTPKISS